MQSKYKKLALKDASDKSYMESLEYLKKYKETGDKEALTWLIENNMRLVYKVANSFKYSNGHKLEFEDLVSAGIEGLLRSIEKFDFELETSFSTYAVYWLKQAMQRAIIYDGYTVRLPVHMYHNLMKTLAYESAHVDDDVPLEQSQILSDLDISEGVYANIQEAKQLWSRGLTSLNTMVSHDGRSVEIQDVLSYNNHLSAEEGYDLNKEASPDAGLYLSEQRAYIEGLLNNLEPRERGILEKRFGLNGYEEMTLQAVGDAEGVTRERIRQIERKALLRLRYLARGESKGDWLTG